MAVSDLLKRTGRAGTGLFLGLLALAACWALPLFANRAGAAEWPQWRGPNRDGISAETGLLKQWPEKGPKLLWTAKGLGIGYASVAVANGLIYTAGNVGAEMKLIAIDLDGQTKWQVKVGPACKAGSPGSRGTPTIDGGKVYYEDANGNVVCLDAKTGEKVWALNILKEFKGRNIEWALSESLLVDGDNVIASPGGPKIGVVALDKNTGKTVWTCKGTDSQPSYASPILVEYKGLRQIVTMNSQAALGIHAKTGELLWRLPHKTEYDANCTTPVYHDGFVFIDSGYRSGGELLQLTVDGEKCSAKEVWRTKVLDNHHGGVVFVDGYLYGAAMGGSSPPRAWVCLDFKTGDVKYQTAGVGKGSVTYADGMLYTMSETGNVGLVVASPEGHKVVSRFHIPPGGSGEAWAHPVICGGRLYLRHGDVLFAFDIQAK